MFLSYLFNWLRNISHFGQTRITSLKRHDQTYSSESLIDEERKKIANKEHEKEINNAEFNLELLLSKNFEIRDLAIDVGSGVGWVSASLSKNFKQVVAIEPSQKALEIAKTLYPLSAYPNIIWKQGFAEDILPGLSIETPALFITGCVLSHLRDKEVIQICEAIEKVSVPGSILCFNECWGKHWQQMMWYSRTKDWWQARFPGWNLDFHGPEVDTMPGIHKGFHGKKIS